MATQRVDLFFTESTSTGSVTYITGGSGTVTIVRLADDYTYDSVTSDFVASGQTLPTLTESATFSGLYSTTFTTTSWDNGLYIVRAEVTKSGESPISVQEIWTVTDGTTSSSTPDAAAANYSRIFIYLSDKPSAIPSDFSCKYLSTGYVGNSAVPLTVTGSYTAGTGLLYYDILQGSTVEIKCISRGVHKTFITPELDTLTLTSVAEIY